MAAPRARGRAPGAADVERSIARGLAPGALGRPLRVLGEVASTNDTLRREAAAGLTEGAAVVALRQTRGRGRHGRPWHSPAGRGLYLSVLLRPDWPPAHAGWLAVLAGLAARRALEALGVRGARIKHPNDVVVRDRKIAGILVEPRSGRHGIEFAVVGIGVNLSHTKRDFEASGLEGRATSCALEGVNVGVAAAAIAVLGELGRLYREFDGRAPAPWRREWERFGGRAAVPDVTADAVRLDRGDGGPAREAT
jgi:BirA family biotin operon repressor/biotin-[acetyl-CoA-carboxylase] ligase